MAAGLALGAAGFELRPVGEACLDIAQRGHREPGGCTCACPLNAPCRWESDAGWVGDIHLCPGREP